MTIITEYLNIQKEHEKKYGERTVVLMQIGAFYEIYEYSVEYCTSEEAKIDREGNVWNESIGHAINISVVLNCVLTYENGNEPYGVSNPHKVGFPVISYEKNRATLLANDYTVIRVDQQKNGGAKGPMRRFVAEVCSPTMQLDHIGLNRPTSNIACIYIEYQQGAIKGNFRSKFDNFLITTGIAVVDVITGQNRVCEFYSKSDDQIHPVQELYRFLISHYPRELIIHIGDMPDELSHHSDANPNPYIDYLYKALELQRFDRLTTHVNEVPQDYSKIAYQIEFLNKIFNKEWAASHSRRDEDVTGIRLNIVQKRNEKIIEDLGFERMNYGRIAYMLLMQHCHYHNTDIISRLSKPDLEWLDDKKHLILTHNAIVQLDLIPEIGKAVARRRRTQIDSLMSVLDQNQTHLGRRYLHNLLQNPMSDPEDIQTFYSMVGEMLACKVQEDPLWLYLERQLKELPDIGRLQRKLEIKLITPKELAVLYKAYIKIINIYLCILNSQAPTLHKQLFAQEDSNSFNQFIARFSRILNFEALECCHVDTSSESNSRWMEFADNPILPGIYSDIDEQYQRLLTAETTLQQIVDHLNTFLVRTTGKKLAYKSAKKKQGATKQDPTGTVLTTTISKANTLGLAPVDVNLCGTLQISAYTSSERIITSDRISAICAEIDTVRMWMRQRILSVYESVIEEMANKYTFYVAVATFVAKVDLVHSYSKVSYRYHYHCPEIVPPEKDGDVSFIQVREIRHPIIERIIDGAYVTNDIALGSNTSNENKQGDDLEQSNGILLFGINTAGKSSLAKALGLNVIMAQAGCYTPSRMRYRPYKKIITRLSGSDNIFKGESSFAVEMTELRTILRQADSNTLVIGDELCKGSETHSGMAITGSAILWLIERKCSFLFATHMHELLNLSYINNIPPEILRICHLSICYNDDTDSLIYDRKIKPGSGSSLYGLMVAKSLGLPVDFINKANEMLLEITKQNKEVLVPKRSRYNGKVYVDSCVICGKTKLDTELQTHHIIEQSTAINNIVTKTFTVNGQSSKLGTMHKNSKDNLIVLCRTCHADLHSSGKELEALTGSQGEIIRVKSG